MKVICSSLLGCLLSASLLACNPAATPKEKQMIEELTSQMKRLCMGRFVMSVPKEMALGGYVTLFFGLDEDYKTVKVQTESFDATPESMRREMDAKAKEIDEDDKNWKTKKSMLLEYRIASDRAIYLRQHDDPISAAASKHELHLLVGKTQLVLKAESYEGVPGAGYYSPDGKVETPEQVAARLFKIAGQIRAVEDPEKAGPGFCMWSVVIDSDNDEESSSLNLWMDKYPDLSIDIDSKALTPDGAEKPLLERVESAVAKFDIDVLRKGEISFAGMKGQEWISTTVSDRHVRLLGFRAESMRPDPSFIRPRITIDLSAGGQLSQGRKAGEYVDSSLTPREAMGLWDAIISSIRLRPDAVRNK